MSFRQQLVLEVLLAALLVLLGHLFVLQRRPDADREALTIRGDTLAYVHMIEGEPDQATAPYTHRLLIPFIASLLPVQPHVALGIISYLSLFGVYWVVLITGRFLRTPLLSRFLGLLIIWACSTHLYNYNNPFLVDAPALLALSLMMLALVRRSFVLFFCAALTGLLIRETILFLLPGWVVHNWKQGLLVLVCGVTLYLAVILLTPSGSMSSGAGFTSPDALQEAGITHLAQPLSYGRNLFTTWEEIWLLAPLGLLLVNSKQFPVLLVSLLLLLGGGIVSTLIATDVWRMLAITIPLFALLMGRVADALVRVSPAWVLMLLLYAVVKALYAVPNRLFAEGGVTFSEPVSLIVRVIVGTIVVLMVLTLWKTILLRFRLHLSHLRLLATTSQR